MTKDQQHTASTGSANGAMKTTKTWCWESEEFTSAIVAQLQRGDVLETRAFLKPIFRYEKLILSIYTTSALIVLLLLVLCISCMKHGIHKNGERDDEMIEMAFAFAEWMVTLSTTGDPARQLAPMPDLQPSYALNTIVTASQRAGSKAEAQRAFQRLLDHGYEPDVFTYTALIDVIARCGEVEAAMKVDITLVFIQIIMVDLNDFCCICYNRSMKTCASPSRGRIS